MGLWGAWFGFEGVGIGFWFSGVGFWAMAPQAEKFKGFAASDGFSV